MSTAGLVASVRARVGAVGLDVHLEVATGEVVAVVGPNGAGKTSLLLAMAGLLEPDEGSVRLDGALLDDGDAGVHVPPERRPVGLCFQDGRLFPHLDVLANVAFGIRRRGASRTEAARRAGSWLERFGLGGRGHARVGELSGGEARRVALARTLATEPRLLLLDEPLSGLDASTRVDIRRALGEHFRESGVTTVLVTHDAVEAMTLASELVVVEDGHVVQRGAAGEIAARPRSGYAADLVGVNLFRGRAAGDRIELGDGASLIAPGAGAGDVFATIHPRAVTLHRAVPQGSPRNVWEGAVTDLVHQGDRMRVQVSGAPPIVAEVTVAAVADLGLAPGAPVWVSVKATEVAVYPA